MPAPGPGLAVHPQDRPPRALPDLAAVVEPARRAALPDVAVAAVSEALTPEQIAAYQRLWDRMDEARRHYPNGTWAQRWLPGVCTHPEVRCVHGDEILHRGFRRIVCLTCGRALNGNLPPGCWFTGRPHASTRQMHHG